jgi:transposase
MGRGGQGQLAVMAVDPGDLLPAGHLVWDVLELVGELDLSRFEVAYRVDGRGHPPYEPRMIVALIVYCRAKGLSSGRQIAAACYDDVGARVITGNRYPTHTVLTRFRRVHAQALRQVLVQTLRLGAGEGLVDVSVVAGDGTKIRANASMDATVEESQLRARIQALQTQVQGLQACWSHQVAHEVAARAQHSYGAYLFLEETLVAPGPPERPDPDPTDPTDPTDLGMGQGEGRVRGGVNAEDTWRKLQSAQQILRARQAALAHLDAHPGRALNDWAERVASHRERVSHREQMLALTRADLQATADRRASAEATGIRLPGTRPVPVEDHIRMRRMRAAHTKAVARLEVALAARPVTTRINTTDPASAIMPGKRGDGFAQRHNVQALAAKNQFILAIATHDSSNDKQALTALLDTARSNLDDAGIPDPIGVALFDNGYASDANFTADVPVDTLLIAVNAGTPKNTTTSGTKMGGDTPAWHVMADRLNDPTNRTLYKTRSTIIEPLFAQLFARFGRTLNLRGDNVQTELHLWALTHNLLKISRHRRKSHPPG